MAFFHTLGNKLKRRDGGKEGNWLGEDGSWMEETCSLSRIKRTNVEMGNKLRHGDGGERCELAG